MNCLLLYLSRKLLSSSFLHGTGYATCAGPDTSFPFRRGLNFARSGRARVVQSRAGHIQQRVRVAQELCHIAGSLLGCGGRIKAQEKRGE